MRRYVALLRGISPTNARMPEIRRCFEDAGFTAVRTVLASGNVAFDAVTDSRVVLAQRAEEAMQRELGRTFGTIVREQAFLHELLAAAPFAETSLPEGVKQVVTFLRRPLAKAVALPFTSEGVHILATTGSEVFTAYEQDPKGPVFMKLLEKTFGLEITTRTLETVRKCADA